MKNKSAIIAVITLIVFSMCFSITVLGGDYDTPIIPVPGNSASQGVNMHIAGKANKHTNAKAIKVKKSSYTLKVNKTATIKPTLVLENSKKKGVEHVAKFRYQSTNTAVATVDKNGKIKAVGKGTCWVYIFANNGKLKSVKVTVK